MLSAKLLKTRITLLALGAVLLGFWALALHTTMFLREDMERLTGEQQATTTALIAARVDGEIWNRISILEQIANEIGVYTPDDTARMQEIIRRHTTPHDMFVATLHPARQRDKTEEEATETAERVTVPSFISELLSRGIEQDRFQVGDIQISQETGLPVFAIALPVHNRRGQTGGVLIGQFSLGQDSFTERIMQGFEGSKNKYLLITPQSRMIFSANERGRIGEKLPAAGVDPKLDELLRGKQENARILKLGDREQLVLAREVALIGWQIIAMEPLTEVLAPFFGMRQRLLFNTLLVTVLVAGLLWWLLRHQLRPLEQTLRTLAAMTDQHQPLRPLPVVRQDEIGQLIGSFNRLMKMLSHRESELRESEARYRVLFSEMLDAYALYEVINDEDGNPCDFRFLSVNARLVAMTGRESEKEFTGLCFDEIFSESQGDWFGVLSRVALSGEPVSFEFHSQRTGRNYEVKAFCPIVGQIACVFADITERQQAEAAVRRSEENFRNFFEKNSTVMLQVDPVSGCIIEANAAAVAYYGYPPDRLKGMSLSEINDMSAERIEAEGLRALTEEGDSYLLVHRLASGELRDVEVHLSPIESGGRTLLFSIVHDVTERRKAVHELAILAQIDMLTGLSNRRHFLEMAEVELSRTLRYGGDLSVLMMDIDHFKKINDTYGHHAGDLVLQAVGAICRRVLRDCDLVGRMGGEEFAAILPQTKPHAAREVAERLRQSIEAARIPRTEGAPLQVTMSLGISTLKEETRSCNIDALISQADKALYEAKRSGRNRVCVSDEAVQEPGQT